MMAIAVSNVSVAICKSPAHKRKSRSGISYDFMRHPQHLIAGMAYGSLNTRFYFRTSTFFTFKYSQM